MHAQNEKESMRKSMHECMFRCMRDDCTVTAQTVAFCVGTLGDKDDEI